jgi:hypothetical protein
MALDIGGTKGPVKPRRATSLTCGKLDREVQAEGRAVCNPVDDEELQAAAAVRVQVLDGFRFAEGS